MLEIDGTNFNHMVCIAVVVLNPNSPAVGAATMEAGFEYAHTKEVRGEMTESFSAKSVPELAQLAAGKVNLLLFHSPKVDPDETDLVLRQHDARCTQRLQYPLVKEYSLNHTRDATIFKGFSLDSLMDPLRISLRNPLRL